MPSTMFLNPACWLTPEEAEVAAPVPELAVAPVCAAVPAELVPLTPPVIDGLIPTGAVPPGGTAPLPDTPVPNSAPLLVFKFC